MTMEQWVPTPALLTVEPWVPTAGFTDWYTMGTNFRLY